MANAGQVAPQTVSRGRDQDEPGLLFGWVRGCANGCVSGRVSGCVCGYDEDEPGLLVGWVRGRVNGCLSRRTSRSGLDVTNIVLFGFEN